MGEQENAAGDLWRMRRKFELLETGVLGCLIWVLAWYFFLSGFCEFGIAGVEKREKKKGRCASLV